MFRGALDVRATLITEEMAAAAAYELAQYACDRGIHEENILPTMDEWEVYPRVAVVTALKAQEQGIARTSKSSEDLAEQATRMIRQARGSTDILMREAMIPPVPVSPPNP